MSKNLSRADALMVEANEADDPARREKANALQEVSWYRALSEQAVSSPDPLQRAAAAQALAPLRRNVRHCPRCGADRECDVAGGDLWCGVCGKRLT